VRRQHSRQAAPDAARQSVRWGEMRTRERRYFRLDEAKAMRIRSTLVRSERRVAVRTHWLGRALLQSERGLGCTHAGGLARWWALVLVALELS
jgi:hypothetical protein